MRVLLTPALIALFIAPSVSAVPASHPRRHARPIVFLATAYCRKGETQSGEIAHVGVVAADPHVLPTGTIVRIDGVGPRTATYSVEDHGVSGRHVDIFIPSCRAARQFGRRHVIVHVVKIGKGQRVRTDGRY
ncbi:MAG: 3D domain-containing protein [Vicinamibacterales bacterium]